MHQVTLLFNEKEEELLKNCCLWDNLEEVDYCKLLVMNWLEERFYIHQRALQEKKEKENGV